jgi:hypothetical protein
MAVVSLGEVGGGGQWMQVVKFEWAACFSSDTVSSAWSCFFCSNAWQTHQISSMQIDGQRPILYQLSRGLSNTTIPNYSKQKHWRDKGRHDLVLPTPRLHEAGTTAVTEDVGGHWNYPCTIEDKGVQRVLGKQGVSGAAGWTLTNLGALLEISEQLFWSGLGVCSVSWDGSLLGSFLSDVYFF